MNAPLVYVVEACFFTEWLLAVHGSAAEKVILL